MKKNSSYVHENLESLSQEFPGLSPDIVKDVFFACDKDCELARNELYALSGKKRKEEPSFTTIGDFSLEEVVGDLFSVDDDVSLCHCVSEDLAMGKGIAVLFKNKFGNVQILKSQKGTIGNGAVLKKDQRYVYYLITKAKYYNKPTYEAVKSSVTWMRDHAVKNGVKEIAMPRIGCGLDGLKWPEVKKILVEVFSSTSIKLKCFSLPTKK